MTPPRVPAASWASAARASVDELDVEGLHPGRRVGAGRRDVEHAVGDPDGLGGEPVVVDDDRDARDAVPVDEADRDRRDAPLRARAPSSRIVETTKNGLRTRSRYSRLATIAAFGSSGSRVLMARVGPSGGSAGVVERGVAAAVEASRSPRRRAGRRCSMNSASRLGSATSKRETAAPRRTTAARIALGSAVGCSSSSAWPGPGRIPVTPSSVASQVGTTSPSRAIRIVRRPLARLRSATVPPATTRPRSTIATDSHSASAASIWWVEKISVRPRREARGRRRAGWRG